jgi:glycosyltransferase involved in cell wall biosynthesis
VLTLLGAFWPSADSSGPNLSYRGLTEALSGEFEFLQVSRDRPFGAAEALVENGRWHDRGYAEARYCAPSRLGAAGLQHILRETRYDVLMLNGFYDQDFTLPALLMRRLGRVPRKPTILSPRGEFAGGAMGLKSGRKAAWRSFARRAGILSDVWLHATSEAERADIERGYPWARGYLTAPNVRALVAAPQHRPGPEGTTRVVFIGRISRVKNLDYALAVLALVRSRVAFEIYGPQEDAVFWQECQRMIAALPENIAVTWRGEIANAAVPRVLAAADLFFLPTRSENFGHAIFEALSCGVPVLISDTTPWRDLEARSAGWDLPLADQAGFARRIDAFAALNQDRRAGLRVGARRAAEHWVERSDAVGKSREMLRTVLDAGASPRLAAAPLATLS